MITGPWFLTGCGEDPPFEYRYLARDVVVVDYQGTQYRLTPEREQDDLPFTYEFEPDGDLNLELDGREYEIESPYDVDLLKKKKRKTSSRKKSLSSSRKRRTSR